MEANKKVFEAVVRRRCIDAVYNRGTVRLAPHIVYTRHGEVYIDAVTLARDGQPPRETKVGAFKLSGLRDLSLTETPFNVAPMFDAADDRYQGVTLLAVED